MDKLILKDLFNRFWKYAVIVGLLIVIFFLFNRTKSLEKNVQESLDKAKEHEIKANFYKGIYDKLLEEDNALEVKYDSLVIEKDKVKILYNEKIKLVDKYSVSDWQRFYDERAIKGSESSNP
jgi:hypothetical protein